jgi:hypothetical protein
MFAGNAFGQPYFGQVSQGGTIPAANPATAEYQVLIPADDIVARMPLDDLAVLIPTDDDGVLV